MPRFVAFLRAINVGGHIVKMDRLCRLFETVGLTNVESFIASGNVLFDSKKSPASLEALIEKGLEKSLGYEVITMIRSASEVDQIVDHVDRDKLADGDGITLYVGLLKSAPTSAAARAVEAMSNDVDTLVIDGRELYWRCNKRFSDSTIQGPKLGKALGVPITTRNVTTVRKLAKKLSPA
ncbi:MAG: DUF1697 domain-containing protein [Acidobacteriota bacterium]|nr:DUF1697 domain-containing protein [Acidobacteriota bacterium]MDQ3420922.1 DUF1697 domain-containing protein [Acidobacteriota bacterium]